MLVLRQGKRIEKQTKKRLLKFENRARITNKTAAS